MDLIQIDLTECAQCGKVCPTGVIAMDEHGPEVIEQLCITCIARGHCVATCPSEALDNVKIPLANQISVKTRSRRRDCGSVPPSQTFY